MSPDIVFASLAAAFVLALGAALALGAIAWIRGAGRWLSLRRARAAVRRLRDTGEGPVILEGVLRGAEGAGPVLLASAIPLVDKGAIPGPNAVNAAAPETWLEMPDGAVLLAGEAVVASGSTEILPGRSSAAVRRALGEIPAELCAIGSWPVRCLAAGDRAQALGRIERAADLDGPSGYRTRPNRYRLFATAPSDRIIISGARLPRPFAAPRRRWTAAGLGAGAALMVGLAGYARLHPPGIPSAGVEGQWGKDAPPEAPNNIGQLLDEARYEEAAAQAEARGDHDRAAGALFLFGDPARAAKEYKRARDESPALPPSYNELDAYIVAHQYFEAEKVATMLADLVEWDDRALDLRCFGRMLRFVGGIKESWPERPPFLPERDDLSRFLCPFAYVDITGRNLDDYSAWPSFGAGEVNMRYVDDPDPPPRLADLLQQEAGRLKEWRMTVSPAARALRAKDHWYRMPLFALQASAAFKAKKVEVGQRVEQAAMAAIWLSFLGEHQAAARSLREAFTHAGLEAAAPGEAPLGYFEAPGLSTFNARRPPDGGRWSTSLLNLGAALALRAGEKIAANAYAELVPKDQGPQVREFVAALLGRDGDPMSHLWSIEQPARQVFLTAAFADDPDGLERSLDAVDGQGLWPIIAPRLKNARPAVLRWVERGVATERRDTGLYGLLGRYAGRRAAAQALGATDHDRVLGERIGRLRKALDERETIVMLYVSGRLASLAPAPD